MNASDLNYESSDSEAEIPVAESTQLDIGLTVANSGISNSSVTVATVDNRSQVSHESNPSSGVVTSNSSSSAQSTSDEGSRSRKRIRNPTQWKKHVKSSLYNTGTGRKVQSRCGCRMVNKNKCKDVTDQQRDKIFKSFWGCKSAMSRQNFIVSHCTIFAKKRTKHGSSRGMPIHYHLPVGKHKVKVCKKQFLHTLSISQRVVHYNLGKVENGIREKPSKRKAHNKLSDEIHQQVWDHINSYPKVDSHYCRATTKREYLESSLNVTKMFEAYCQMHRDGQTCKDTYYRKVFNTEFNLGFHVPSNDICDSCDMYKKKQQACTVTEEDIAQHEAHLRRKDLAEKEKLADKKRTDALAVTFDMQQVLTAPRLFAGVSYYKRKLNVYNLTFYELQTGQGYCYTWHEADAGRGSNEIASCLTKYLESLDKKEYKHVILYSDTAGGQNRNRGICTAIISFLSSSKHIAKVEQKYFESGHSHMECDSMHSAIQSVFEKREVDLPCEYHGMMKAARTKKGSSPYHVIEMTTGDMKGFTMLSKDVMKADPFKGIINVHHILYNKTENDPAVQMAKEINGEFQQIEYRRRGGKKSLQTIPLAYEQSPGIDVEKKKDIMTLVPLMTSKTMGQLFYSNLPVKGSTID